MEKFDIPDGTFNKTQAAKYLTMSVNTLKKLISSGQIKVMPMGDGMRERIPASELREFLQRQLLAAG